ncbi:N-alpha-acetyltransferase 15, NatA auxiliary subunit [Portunus trituberculatus]|uniref:N-alpha-acetyltransferase 15, NatA auxiliary subunit n=1 Tax=Portunus trituberculatus TaxID=210409 RepID=A0A5B7FAL8_PORTR|nr:N-alpha-acetyltransferase 15, NatA auxiliary subunit [Portunus trituberculatus]
MISESISPQDDVDNHPTEDLDPSKLERTEEPLAEAIHFLKPLQSLAPQRIQTHLMAFEIYIRKGKPLLMLQALKRALDLEPNNPELHTCLIRFLQYRQEKLQGHHSVVVDVINREVNRLLPTTDPTQLNEDFLNNNQDSVPHRLQDSISTTNLTVTTVTTTTTAATATANHNHVDAPSS